MEEQGYKDGAQGGHGSARQEEVPWPGDRAPWDRRVGHVEGPPGDWLGGLEGQETRQVAGGLLRQVDVAASQEDLASNK